MCSLQELVDIGNFPLPLGDIPPCWEKTFDKEFENTGAGKLTYHVLRLRDEKRNISLKVTAIADKNPDGWCESRFFKNGKYVTFDKRGISWTFTVNPATHSKTEPKNVGAGILIFEEMYTKAMAAPSNIAIPGTKLEVSPGRLEDIKANLRDGKTAMISPAGMGQGIFITPNKPMRRQGFLECPKEWCDIFGAPRLWYVPVDCD